jgi:hypothetical protein
MFVFVLLTLGRTVMLPVIPQQVPDLADNKAKQTKQEEEKDKEEEDDIKFIQPLSKKRVKVKALTSQHHNTMDNTYVKCHWKKHNSECQLRMYLSCCVESN